MIQIDNTWAHTGAEQMDNSPYKIDKLWVTQHMG